MKKRILIWETSDKISGGQTMTIYITSMLKDVFDFIYIIPKKGPLSCELEKMSIKYYLAGSADLPFGKKKISNIFDYLSISKKWIRCSNKIIREEKPDLLYCPGPAALPWSAICGKKAKLPVIWHLHHLFVDKKTRILLKHYSKLRCVKKIIAVSNVVLEQLNNKTIKNKGITLYNPVDYDRFNSGNDLFYKEIVKEFDFLNNDKPLIVSHIGNIQRSKNQIFSVRFLDTFASFYKKPIVCLFVGKTTDDIYEKELHQFVCGINNQYVKYTFLGERKDIPNILRVTDCIVIPSSAEGFPLAGLEAMCAGVPVIGTDGGAKELIDVSGAGVFFPYNNVEMACNALKQVLETKAYANNGRAFAKSLSFDSYREKIKKIFEVVK